MHLTHDEIRALFKSKGLKVTPQRVAIYTALAETTCHPTASDLYHQVALDYPMISHNTVYYTLSSLREVGLVKEVNYWHDQARFDANVTPHHHLICLCCRAILDIENRALNRLASSSAIPQDFHVIDHQVEFYGFCPACQHSSKQFSSAPSHSITAQHIRRTRYEQKSQRNEKS